MKLKIDTDFEREMKSSQNSKVDFQRNTINNINNVITSLESQWEGEAASTFNVRFNQLASHFKNLLEIYNECETDIDNYKNTITEIDKSLGGR